MRKVLMGAFLCLMVTACAITQQKDFARVYQDVSMKATVVATIASLKDLGYDLKSTASPAEGMTVIDACRDASQLTVSIYEPEAKQVQVDVISVLNSPYQNGAVDFALNAFYQSLDKHLGVN